VNKQAPILITGGSGLIGNAITRALRAESVPVRWLSRNTRHTPEGVQVYFWDPARGSCDAAALTGVETIVHLAGAGIADARWSPARKQEIIGSRVSAARTLFATLQQPPHRVKTIVAASAIGFYGDRQDEWLDEKSAPGAGFLSETCMEWERELGRFAELGIRLVILRVGFVLSRDGGALPVMKKPVDWFAGAPLGTGGQYLSWIDLDDLVGQFRFAMEHEDLQGIFNAVAPSPVTNRAMIQAMGKVLRRPVWPVPVPGFLLRLLLGEQSVMVTAGQRVSSEKIQQAGFRFRYPDVEASLRHHLL
jgi:hypothetical protein